MVMKIIEVFQGKNGVGFRHFDCGRVSWFPIPIDSEDVKCKYCEENGKDRSGST